MAPSLGQIWFIALHLPYWAKYECMFNAPPSRRITGALESKYHISNHVISDTCAVRFSWLQGDFLAKFQDYRPTFGAGLG